MTYAELVAAIKSYTESDFSTVDVNLFITQAETRIYNTVQIAYLRKNVTGTITGDNKYLAVPDDWLDTYSLAVIDGSGNYSYLLNKDVNFIRESFPLPATTGLPEYYALFDDSAFILGPTPDTGYSVELHYYYYPLSITNNNTASNTTWIGDNYSTVLLYGSLLEANTFLKGEPDVMEEYQKRYDAAVGALKQLSEYKNRNDSYRAGQARKATL
jgi:hypothetical protein|tara:strand:- start:23 stop:664 length:642 start_codon:yes stop_codon:yes gene_type:complete